MSRTVSTSQFIRRIAVLVVVLLSLTIMSGLVSAQGDSQTYVVQAGDTLESIAAQHGVTIQALADANALADPNLIFVGQELIIPGDGSGGGSASGSTTTSANATTYTVQPRDTIDTIGQQLNVAASAIIAANFGSGDNPALIMPGQVLTIPGGAPPYFDAAGQPTNAVVATGTDGQGGGSVPTSDVVTTTAAFSGGESYVVQPGDVLDTIGQAFDVAVESIAYASGLEFPYILTPGQVLTIPVGATPYGIVPPAPGQPGFGAESGGGSQPTFGVGGATTETAPSTADVIGEEGGGGADMPASGQGGGGVAYVVEEGDSILSIVFGLGLDLEDFLRANPNLLNDVSLEPGDELVIP